MDVLYTMFSYCNVIYNYRYHWLKKMQLKRYLNVAEYKKNIFDLSEYKKNIFDLSEWVTVIKHLVSNFSAKWCKQISVWWDNDGIHFGQDQHA